MTLATLLTRLEAARLRRLWSYRQLCQALDLNPSTLYNVKRRRHASALTRAKIAHALQRLEAPR